jgi:hypothetical protein
VAFFDFDGFAQFGESARFAGSDEHLPRFDPVEHKVLPPRVQFGQDII